MKSVILAILAATAASAETVTVKLIGATTVGTVTLDRGAANKTIGFSEPVHEIQLVNPWAEIGCGFYTTQLVHSHVTIESCNGAANCVNVAGANNAAAVDPPVVFATAHCH